MLKANSKQVKEKINNYIIDSFQDYTQRGADGRDIDFIKDYIVRVVLNERLYDKDNNHRRAMDRQGFKSLYQVFKDWMQGLPSVLDACYYYNINAVDLLGDILEETQEERAKYSEADAEEFMTQLIYNSLYDHFLIWFNRDINREALDRGE